MMNNSTSNASQGIALSDRQPPTIFQWIHNDRVCSVLIGIASVLFFLFVAFRAFSVPFTHDESFSYLNFADSHSFKEILFQPAYSSGNHLLNTVLMKVIGLVLRPDDWTLRLPSLFAYALFLYAGFRICRHLFKPPNQVAVFILLNLNMFLLQFFSLARGYGLALSFMMTSIWLFMQSLDPDTNRPFSHALALGTAALACFANLSFLNYYCALLLIGTVIRFRCRKRIEPRPKFLQWCVARIMTFWDSILITTILAGTLIPYAIELRKLDQFYYGGNKSFIEDTILTLINAYLYRDSDLQLLLPAIGRWIWVIPALPFVFYAMVSLFAGGNPRAMKASSLYWIMFASAISIVVQHHVLGTPYPFDRAALLFVPMFVLSAAWLFAWEGKQSQIWMRFKTGFLFIIVLGLAAWKFSQDVNVSYARPWKYDSMTRVMLNDLQAAKIADGKPVAIRLGMTMPLYPSAFFYAKVKGFDWLEKVDGEGIKNRFFDYYYIRDEDLDYARSAKASILKHYNASGTWLMRASPPQ